MRTSLRSLIAAAVAGVVLLNPTNATALNPNPMIDGGGAPEPQTSSEPTTLRTDLESSQWFLDTIGARDLSAVGRGVTVAVLADGVSPAHPDLAGRVLDGRDVTTSQPVLASRTREPGDLDARLGTFVATLIAGSADRAGVRGVAPAAKILPVIVESDRSNSESQVADGIDWAAANGADVIVYAGALTSALIPQAEDRTCRAITAARAKGVPTFVAAGNEFDVLEPKFFPARCADAVAVAPLSATLTEANGFRNVVSPMFAAPATRVVSATADLDWLPYTDADLADWAPAIAAGAYAVLRGSGLDTESSLKALRDSATDLGPAGVDARSGAGLIDVAAALGFRARRTESQVISLISAVSTPRVQDMTSDGSANFAVSWEPPVGVTVTGYRVDVYRWQSGGFVRNSYPQSSAAVRAVIGATLDPQTYVVVTAITADGERPSLPSNQYNVKPFEPAPNPYAAVTAVAAKWTKDGLSVKVTTNAEGNGAKWNLAILDGWTTERIFTAEVANSDTYLFRQPIDAELRSLPLYVLGTINGEKVSVGVQPQYLLTATGLSAGKTYAAVTGTTNFACMDTIKVKSGCEGALVKVVDLKTNKTIATTYVLSDLTYTVTFPWKTSTLRVQVRISDPANEVISAPLNRPLTTRK